MKTYADFEDRQTKAVPEAPEREHVPMEQVIFDCGAKRSSRKPRYDLLVPGFLRAMAQAMTEGVRYGEMNWLRGDREFAIETFNHLEEHLNKFIEGDTREDSRAIHLAKVAVNAMFVWHFYIRHPEWFEDHTAMLPPDEALT
jgi:hypothetical protein